MISVIIPVHNRANLIGKCIKSVLNQTEKNFEIIVVDDHSNDDLSEAVRKASQNDQRVSLYSLDNNFGVSAARNLGMSKSKGDWICFLDSDDYWEENLLEVLLRTGDKTKADIVIAGFDMVLKTGEVIKESKSGKRLITSTGTKMLEAYGTKGFGQYCCWGRLFRREIIKDISFPRGVAMAEDRIFMTYAYANASKVVYVPGVFFHVLLHDNNAQWGGFNPWLEYNEIKEFDKTLMFYNQHVGNEKSRKEAGLLWYREKALILRRMFKSNTRFSKKQISRYYKEAIHSLKKDQMFIMKNGGIKDRFVAIMINCCPLLYCKSYYLAEKYIKGVNKSKAFQ